jgi:chromate transport protein ChrA
MQIVHMFARWAHIIFIVAMVAVVVAFFTIPVVNAMLSGLGRFIAVLFAEVGITILRKAVDIINGIAVP